MNEILFDDIEDFKKCMYTIKSKNGLLDRRGYVLHKNYDDIDYEIINDNNNIEMMGKRDNLDDYIYFYFVNNTSFLSKSYKTKSINNINVVESTIKKLYDIPNSKEINIDLVIILTQKLKLNNYILEKKIVDKIDIENIQIFQYTHLLFNITLHSKSPTSIKVISKEEDIKQICKLKNIDDKNKLPKIMLTDPLANFYGLKIGELFEFERTSRNAGKYIYYRVCTI